MLEVELKSLVDDVARRRTLVEAAGATLLYTGRLEDRRYDTPDRSLAARDEVLRMRVYHGVTDTRAELDWKGPTRREKGFKLREELAAGQLDAVAIASILERLGYVVTMEIDRDIAQYDLGGAMVRFEHYPRMDELVEVEGTPEQIETAIVVLELPRNGFTSERLPDFALRFQHRTGLNAALSDKALAGDAQFDISNA